MPLAGDIPQPSSETEEILAEQSGAGAPFSPQEPRRLPTPVWGRRGLSPRGCLPTGTGRASRGDGARALGKELGLVPAPTRDVAWGAWMSSSPAARTERDRTWCRAGGSP